MSSKVIDLALGALRAIVLRLRVWPRPRSGVPRQSESTGWGGSASFAMRQNLP